MKLKVTKAINDSWQTNELTTISVFSVVSLEFKKARKNMSSRLNNASDHNMQSLCSTIITKPIQFLEVIYLVLKTFNFGLG